MDTTYHRLLARQIRRLGGLKELGNELQQKKFLTSVSEAYRAHDREVELTSRASELSGVELLAANEQLRALFATMPDRILRTNGSGVVIEIESTGRGTAFDHLACTKTGASIEECDRLTNERGDIEVEAPAQDGRQNGPARFCFERRDVPLADGGRLVILRDVTDLRNAEEALKQKEEELRHSQRIDSLGRLAGGVAHDFNNLLQAISGNCEFLKEQPTDEEELGTLLDEISSMVDRGASLTRQLLYFARKQETNKEVCDLNKVVEEISSLLRRVLHDRIDFNVRACRGPAMVFADKDQLGQVLVNLAVNARDAMPNGGTLKLGTSPVEMPDGTRWIQLELSDTGVGMSEEVLERAFEPFFTTKGPSHGTGLGLSTVYGIVQGSGGRIEIDSKIGSGTTFRVFLPETETEQEAAARPRITRGRASGQLVLLAEDDRNVRGAITKMLRSLGYGVIVAQDGREALDMAPSVAPQLAFVLSDVRMPNMTGPEMAEHLREVAPELQVVFMSGFIADEGEEWGIDEDRLIRKPFSRTALANFLDEHIAATSGDLGIASHTGSRTSSVRAGV